MFFFHVQHSQYSVTLAVSRGTSLHNNSRVMLDMKGMSERKACALLGLCRASLGYLMCFWLTCQSDAYSGCYECLVLK